MDEPTGDGYFRWLCDKVQRYEVPAPSSTYWKLFKHLFDTEFIWLISGDDNRAEDGIELRLFFSREVGLEYKRDQDPVGCSVLEMLIAFAARAEFATDETVFAWFWIFLYHLDLADACDGAYSEAEVTDKLNKFIWRTYKGNGRGGLFPLEHPKRDQRKVEIWYQFCAYLEEQGI